MIVALCILIAVAAIGIHEALRTRNAKFAIDNRAIDRVFYPIAICAGVVGMMAM